EAKGSRSYTNVHSKSPNKAHQVSPQEQGDDLHLQKIPLARTGRQDIKQGYARVRWKVGLFRGWIMGSICWVAYSFWNHFSSTDEEELRCWRRLLGIEEGPSCYFQGVGAVAEDALWTFGPPLLAGIAILAVTWIVAGFQRRT